MNPETAAFAMAHPVCAAIIAVVGIICLTVLLILFLLRM
jgi:hypothetical protein